MELWGEMSGGSMEGLPLIGGEGKAKGSLEQGNGFIQSGIMLRHPFLAHQKMEKHRNCVLNKTLLEQEY